MHTVSALALFQDSGSNDGNIHWIMIFVGVMAFCSLVQLLVLAGAGLAAMKAQKAVMAEIAEVKAAALKEVAEIKGKIMPLVAEGHTLLTDLTPEVKTISAKVGVLATNLETITGVVKDKLKEFEPTIDAAKVTMDEANATARDANRKAHEQVERVNGMVSDLLSTTTQMGKSVHYTITQPVREVSGLVAGVRTAFTTLLKGGGRSKPPVYRAPVGTYDPVPEYVRPVDGYTGDKP